MGGRGGSSGGGGTGGGSSGDDGEIGIDETPRDDRESPAYDKFQKAVDEDMKKANSIINSGKNKSDIIKDLKGMGYILDSNTKKGDIHQKIEDLIKRRHTPNIWKK